MKSRSTYLRLRRLISFMLGAIGRIGLKKKSLTMDILSLHFRNMTNGLLSALLSISLGIIAVIWIIVSLLLSFLPIIYVIMDMLLTTLLDISQSLESLTTKVLKKIHSLQK